MSKRQRRVKARQRELLQEELTEPPVPKKTKTKALPVLDEEEGQESGEDEEGRQRHWASGGSDEGRRQASLPILSAAGKWVLKTVRAEKTSSSVSSAESESEDGAERVAECELATPSKSEAEIRAELAHLAIILTEETEENLAKFKEIFLFFDRQSYPDGVVRLALLTTLAVLKDVMPGYHIRPLSEAEKKATVSKDVKRIRNFEEGILGAYRKFLDQLGAILQPKKHRLLTQAKNLPLVQIAVSCVCELLGFASHFNYFDEVLRLAAVSLSRLPHTSLVERVVDAFRDMFNNDAQGQVTFVGVRLLSNLVKEREYDVPAVWMRAVETVRVQSDVAGRATSSKGVLAPRGAGKHLSGRQKKELKAKREELVQMAKAEEVATREQKQKWNSEILKYLFRIYFGILKANPTTALLPSVLAGISRHAHRIGVEYFADLLHSLRSLLEGRGAQLLDIESTLHCILTVDRIYSLNENLAEMDLKFFYNCFFVQLGRLAAAGGRGGRRLDWSPAVEGLLQRCFSGLFHPKRHIPAARAAAFAQRLADLALALQGHSAGGMHWCLGHLKGLLTHQERARGVLDREPFGQGSYSVASVDPDLCNPFARSLAEPLLALKHSDHGGKVRSLVDQILALAPK